MLGHRLTYDGRYESLKHCKWVDEVVEDAPWVVEDEFIAAHQVCVCACGRAGVCVRKPRSRRINSEVCSVVAAGRAAFGVVVLMVVCCPFVHTRECPGAICLFSRVSLCVFL